jgi:hypothetical protein
MENQNGAGSVALLVEPIRSRGRATLPVAFRLLIDQTLARLHRPYKEPTLQRTDLAARLLMRLMS